MPYLAENNNCDSTWIKALRWLTKPFYWLSAFICLLLLITNLLVLPSLVLINSLLAYLPIPPLKRRLLWLNQTYLPPIWVAMNNAILASNPILSMDWDIRREGKLDTSGSYLIISNHQTWADILVLEKIFAGSLPKIKFFMKQELLWLLPICGLACKKMGYPFIRRMRRIKGKQKESASQLRQVNKQRIQASLSEGANLPTALLIFLEGHRFSTERHKQQASPYAHLLKPYTLGFGLALDALADQLTGIVNVTIIYENKPSLWGMLSGNIGKISVHYELLDLPLQEVKNKIELHRWVLNLWKEKDQRIVHYFQQFDSEIIA